MLKICVPNLDVVKGRTSKFWSPELRHWTGWQCWSNKYQYVGCKWQLQSLQHSGNAERGYARQLHSHKKTFLTTPSYGYEVSVSIPPLSLTYVNAWSMSPPSQPWLPYLVEQSTRFCSLSDTSLPVLRKCWPSNDPVCIAHQQQVVNKPWKFHKNHIPAGQKY